MAVLAEPGQNRQSSKTYTEREKKLKSAMHRVLKSANEKTKR